MTQKRFIKILLITGIILFVILILSLTNSIDWDIADFSIATFLLLGVGFTSDFVVRKIKNKNHRVTLISLLILFFLLVWMEMAVGIFGTPFAGN